MLPDPSPSLPSYLQAVHGAMRSGDLQRASEIAQQAIDCGFEDSQLLTIVAYRKLGMEDYPDALKLAARACDLAPRNIDALHAAGSALQHLGRSEEAVPYFERALALAPRDADLLARAAGIFEHLRQSRRACDLLELALRLSPQRADVAARLAFIHSNRGNMKEARAFGTAALALDPTQAFAAFAVATADIDEGHCEAACQRIRKIMRIPNIGRVITATALRILGDALDGLGSYDDAFQAYAKGGHELQHLYAPPAEAHIETALSRSRRIAAYVRNAPEQAWAAPKGCSPIRSHVFLLGFPRSGTTLLTHVLNAHPDIAALDEPRTLTDSSELVASNSGLDMLAGLSGEELAPYRESYWRRVREAGFTGEKPVLLEKMPLYSEILCLIAKLFPDAKILIAVRDPRDVVFSCFRRRFAFTRQMYELLTLQGAAAYYDATMQLLELYRGKVDLPFREVRHEALVSDFEGQTRDICEFIGVDPDVALRGYAERARNSDMTTPNAAQIGRGIRRKSMGQWRPYAAHMEPVMPLLAPWIAKFGYDRHADPI